MKKSKDIDIPNSALEQMARCIFPEIQKFFESEDGQREFTEWKAKQSKKGKRK